MKSPNENGVSDLMETLQAGLHKPAGYLENIVLLGDQIILNVGGRFDYHSGSDAPEGAVRIQP